MTGHSVGPAWGAVLSDDKVYRYVLRRAISMLHGSTGTITFVMLNPSTADADTNDPTIRRCIGFGEALHAEYLEVVNLFAFRTTYPRELLTAKDAVGPRNDEYIRASVRHADVVICAWGSTGAGAVHRQRLPRTMTVLEILRDCGKVPHCLGVTKDGDPLHPLYLAGSRRPVSLADARAAL